MIQERNVASFNACALVFRFLNILVIEVRKLFHSSDMEYHSDAQRLLRSVTPSESIFQWNIYNLKYWKHSYHGDRLESPRRITAERSEYPLCDMVLFPNHEHPNDLRNVVLAFHKHRGHFPTTVQLFAPNGRLVWENARDVAVDDQKPLSEHDLEMSLPELLLRIRPDYLKKEDDRLLVRALYPSGRDMIELNTEIAVMSFSHDGASEVLPQADKWQTVLWNDSIHLKRRFNQEKTDFRLWVAHKTPCLVLRDTCVLVDGASNVPVVLDADSSQPPVWTGEVEHIYQNDSSWNWSHSSPPNLINLRLKVVNGKVFGDHRTVRGKGGFRMKADSFLKELLSFCPD